MSIKAIETRYNGYKFRSRLEARYAVFFDKFGMSWEYEPEGFSLSNPHQDDSCKFSSLINYLPDFRISLFGLIMWAEVKPEEFCGIELYKANLLCCCDRRPVLLLVGTPEIKPYSYLHYQESNCWGNGYDCPLGGGEYSIERVTSPLHYMKQFPLAIEAARSARFEHGQCG